MIILLLARHVAGQQPISDAAVQRLEHYDWPENVTELRGVILRAAQLAGDRPIEDMHVPAFVHTAPDLHDQPAMQLQPEGVNLEEVEQNLIRQALERARGNKSKAAELLGD